MIDNTINHARCPPPRRQGMCLEISNPGRILGQTNPGDDHSECIGKVKSSCGGVRPTS